MRKRKQFIQEENQVLKEELAHILAKLIVLHYKYYKNNEADTFEQYHNIIVEEYLAVKTEIKFKRLSKFSQLKEKLK